MRARFPLIVIFSAVLPVSAHVLSMSSGDLTIQGAHARYELRMPLYEVSHTREPERALLDHIRFGGASLGAHECRAESARDLYICTAEYEFPSAPDRIEVECTFPDVTVSNHVHLLRAEMAGKHDQALFDLSFPRATLRFRPPTRMETVVSESGAGFMRAWGGAAQILFLAALALAGRSRKEVLTLAAMFLAGQVAAVLIVPHTAWQPAPRFVEAATALTVSYLAVEILLLPKAGSRWLVALVLGAVHGLYFHLFLQTTGYHKSTVLAGAFVAEAIAIATLSLTFLQLDRVARVLRPVQVSASALFVFGMVWFFLRLQNCRLPTGPAATLQFCSAARLSIHIS